MVALAGAGPKAIPARNAVFERPDCFSRFIDPALRHLAPQLVRDASGAEGYAIPGTQRPIRIGVLAGDGMTLAERKLHFLTT